MVKMDGKKRKTIKCHYIIVPVFKFVFLGHDGCVNCLNFNYAGTKLASGSDDLEIKIWNYTVGKLLTSFNSKHRSNVFQVYKN
jgi:WD40 repeat protein